MRKKIALLAILLLSASFALSLNAEDCVGDPRKRDMNIICRAQCQGTGWCQWSLAYQPGDTCYADPVSGVCSQLNPPSCQCTQGSLPLF
jgi:hypothetical protein